MELGVQSRHDQLRSLPSKPLTPSTLPRLWVCFSAIPSHDPGNSHSSLLEPHRCQGVWSAGNTGGALKQRFQASVTCVPLPHVQLLPFIFIFLIKKIFFDHAA